MFVINKGLDNYDNSVLCSASSKTFSLSSACQIVVVIKNIYVQKMRKPQVCANGSTQIHMYLMCTKNKYYKSILS